MDYLINNYRAKKFRNKYLVTTDHGSYCILSLDEFKRLSQNNIDDPLKTKLEKKEIILSHSNINETARLIRNRNDFLFHGTSLHIVVVTLRCNMKCIYCHASSRRENEFEFDMNKETARKTVDFIFQTPNDSITIEFQGGEPLLNWGIVKYIINYSKEKNKKAKKNLRVTIVTNLTEMDEEKMDYLINHNIGVCTSLDGPKEVHDYNRKYTGRSNYEIVTQWIKKFSKEYKRRGIKNKRINALVTLTNISLKKPEAIIDEYTKLGLKEIHLRFLNNLGVARKVWAHISYPSNKYLKFWKKAVSHIVKLQKEGKKINERMVSIMTNKIQNEFDPNYLDLRSPCGAAIGQLAYNYNGDIYTCDEGRMIGDDLFWLGNVKKDNYKSIMTSNKVCAVITASLNDQYICNSCVYKPYCGICPVCNYAEQGNVVGKIPQTDRCKIFKEQFDWVIREKFINNINNK